MDFSPSVIRPPVREVVRQAVRNPLILAASGGPSLTAQVQALFASRNGGMWDFGDLSTLFQDTAGATPVTAAGQSIARVNDKSGNSANCTQATGISQPLYQVVSTYGCAQFDGANDILQATGINLSSANKALIGLAFKPNTSGLSLAYEYSANASLNDGSFYVALNEGGSGLHNLKAHATGGGLGDTVQPSSALALAATTLVEYIDLTQAAALSKITARINGAAASLSSVADGGDSPGNFGNYDLFMGARSGGSVASNMNLYRAFVREGSATAGEQLILENWLRESCGV